MKAVMEKEKIAVWILLLYTYLIWLKALIISAEEFITPALLFFVLILTLLSSKGRIVIGNGALKIQAVSWIIIIIYILINNPNFLENLVKHGMIQLFVMIMFMIMCIYSEGWINTWIKWSKVYAWIHSIATIYFQIFPNR